MIALGHFDIHCATIALKRFTKAVVANNKPTKIAPFVGGIDAELWQQSVVEATVVSCCKRPSKWQNFSDSIFQGVLETENRKNYHTGGSGNGKRNFSDIAEEFQRISIQD